MVQSSLAFGAAPGGKQTWRREVEAQARAGGWDRVGLLLELADRDKVRAVHAALPALPSRRARGAGRSPGSAGRTA